MHIEETRKKHKFAIPSLAAITALMLLSTWNDDDDDDDSNDEINSTFNHAIGLPEKNGIQMPLFDYEKMLYNAIE